MPEDRAAGFWRDHHTIHAGQALPRVEIAEGISAELPHPGNLPGKRSQPSARGCCPLGAANMGGGEGRVPSSWWDLHYRGSQVAPTEEINLLVLGRTGPGHAQRVIPRIANIRERDSLTQKLRPCRAIFPFP